MPKRPSGSAWKTRILTKPTPCKPSVQRRVWRNDKTPVVMRRAHKRSIMGVPRFQAPKAATASPPWSYSNKSTLLRFGALVALSNVAGAAPCDILTFGEIKAPSTAPAMVLIGVCSMAGPENALTTALTVDGTGVTNTPVTSIGRHKLILSAESDRHPGEPVLDAGFRCSWQCRGMG